MSTRGVSTIALGTSVFLGKGSYGPQPSKGLVDTLNRTATWKIMLDPVIFLVLLFSRSTLLAQRGRG